MIIHVALLKEWMEQQNHPAYAPASLSQEGFIHCCLTEQLEGVLQRYFTPSLGIALLSINEKLLQPEVKYEESKDGEKFPHVYGSIHRQAIVSVEILN